MSAFKRAYRDPKSPLTPIIPRAENTCFNFNFGGDNSLKPFIEAIQQTKESAESSPADSVKYVNPSKYIKRELNNFKSNDIMPERESKTRKLSPRFIATKKCEMQAKCASYGIDNELSCERKVTSLGGVKLRPKVASINTSNKANIDENTLSSTSYQHRRPHGSSTYYFKNEPNSNCSVNDSNLHSDLSSDSNASFASNSSTYSSSRASGAGNRHQKPPKLVLNDTTVEETVATMSSVFNWVWNRLSPMKNPSIYELLTRVGMQKYWKDFKREEILDLDVFSTLTLADLEAIGIRDADDCVKILKSVGMALNFLSGLFVCKKP